MSPRDDQGSRCGRPHLPVAVPPVVVGLASPAVAAAVARTDPAFADVAASLRAGPARVLWRVPLPMLLPATGAAANLSLAATRIAPADTCRHPRYGNEVAPPGVPDSQRGGDVSIAGPDRGVFT